MVIKMIKRLEALFIAASLLFIMLSGCHQKEAGKTDSDVNSDSSFSFGIPAEDDSLSAAEGKSIAEFKTIRFHAKAQHQSLYIDLPASWVLEKPDDQSAYNILCSKQQIGKIFLNSEGEADAKTEVISSSVDADKILQQIKYTYSDGNVVYTRCLYIYDMNNLKIKNTYRIEVNAGEIDEQAMSRVSTSVSIKPDTQKTDTDLIDKNKTGLKAAIIGNSFVYTSQIGEILGMMTRWKNKSITFDPVSRGYYTVSKYCEDQTFMDKISSGAYDIIFLCGFYSSDDEYTFNEFVDLCKKSDTKLVIFPAHNEYADSYLSAYNENDGIYLADWKALINSLISDGLPDKYFVLDDSNKHSTELGGYAGACLLYSMMYKEAPPSLYRQVLSSYSDLSSYGINNDNAKEIFEKIEKKAVQFTSDTTPAYEI